jgi:hypothetical protein
MDGCRLPAAPARDGHHPTAHLPLAVMSAALPCLGTRYPLHACAGPCAYPPYSNPPDAGARPLASAPDADTHPPSTTQPVPVHRPERSTSTPPAGHAPPQHLVTHSCPTPVLGGPQPQHPVTRSLLPRVVMPPPPPTSPLLPCPDTAACRQHQVNPLPMNVGILVMFNVVWFRN